MNASQLDHLAHDWNFWAREEQLAPTGDWRVWLFMGGRGAGKTRAGAEWVSGQARTGRAGRIALVGPTFHDVRDANIDVVGVDWYPPLTDWRAGDTHPDAELARCTHDLTYLEGRIEAGENFDWYYASETDRTTLSRTPITDGVHGEPWIYRAKDVRSFWNSAHHDRPGGVRSAAPTAWVPQAKPIWFVELGVPAVDKGANAPNLFLDAKSAESALPPFSTGARDDLIQRRALEAYLRHWDVAEGANPISALTGKPMIEAAFLWCWDARPHPAFPARADVWADGASWRRGHWMNGRAGLSNLGEVVLNLCLRAGVKDVDATALLGAVSGYIVDAPAAAREALEPLMAAYDFTAAERDGKIVFFHRDDEAPRAIRFEDLAAASAGAPFAQRGDAAEAPVEARVRFLDAARDYLVASVSARRLDRAEGGVETLDAPLVLDVAAAEALARGVLADRRAASESLHIELGPAHAALEPGDRIVLEGGADAFEIARIDDAESRRLELHRARSASPSLVGGTEPGAPRAPAIAPTPVFAILDLPPLTGAEDDARPLAAVFAAPWLGAHEVCAGPQLARRASVAQPAIMGELVWPLWPGPLSRWDEANRFRIALYGGALQSVAREAVLDGANVFAIEADSGWEIVQARACVLVAAGVYEISGMLRGQLGSAHAMRAPHPAGARIVKLDERLARVDIGAHEWNEALAFAAPPAGALPTDTRAATGSVTLPHAASRPWAPAHVRARRVAGGDVAISWVRCARIGGDAWGPGEPALGSAGEAYRLEILDGSSVKRSVDITSAGYLYAVDDQAVDFGALPASLRLRVAQLDASGVPGLNKELTITL